MVTASAPPRAPDREGRDPVLVADDLRVDLGGRPACDGITLRTTGDRVLVLGAPRPVFQAVCGLLPVVRGRLAVRGVSAAEAAARRIVAGVPAEMPAPPKWTALEYITSSARLAGVASASLRVNVDSAVERLGLGALAKTQLRRLPPAARRATLVAAALATGADLIALEDPLGGLPDDVAEGWGHTLTDGLSERSWLVFAPRMPLASALARAADEAIVATASRVDAQGPPAELAAAERRFVARFDGSVDAIASALAERGARITVQGAHSNLDLGPELSTTELARICDRAGVAIVELVPAFRALS